MLVKLSTGRSYFRGKDAGADYNGATERGVRGERD